MKDRNWWLIISVILFVAVVLAYLGLRNDQSQVEVPATPEQPIMTGCTDAQKAAEICTMDYTPVCGDDGETYSNVCSACSSGNIDSYSSGECN